jgi:hypothetical protein
VPAPTGAYAGSGLCSVPLVGLPNQAVLADSEGVREQILPSPSRGERVAVACGQERSAPAAIRVPIGPTVRSGREWPPPPREPRNSVGTFWARGFSPFDRVRQKPPLNCSLSGRDRRRSGDLTLFRRALYLLSYPTG